MQTKGVVAVCQTAFYLHHKSSAKESALLKRPCTAVSGRHPALMPAGRDADAAGLRWLLAVGAAARAALLAFSFWQDATMAVKYTDIDYQASLLSAG